METYEEEEYVFTLPVANMFADLCEVDPVAVDVLEYLAQNPREIVTIGTLAEKIYTPRRVLNTEAEKRHYDQKQMPIGRSRAERVVEKLAFAGLIYIQPRLPLKVLTLSVRGQQVIVLIKTPTEE